MNEHQTKESGESAFYFQIHLLILAGGVSVFLTVIGWLIWRIVVGGAYELVLGLTVSGVLMCIMLTGWGAALVIALDGRSKKESIKPIPAQPKVVSADRWMITDPFQRRGPL